MKDKDDKMNRRVRICRLLWCRLLNFETPTNESNFNRIAQGVVQMSRLSALLNFEITQI